MINELAHHYHLGESIFRDIRSYLDLDKIPPSKQNKSRLDALFCGYTVYLCPIKRMLGLNELHTNEPPRWKTNNVVSEQVLHNPACTATDAG